MLELRPELSPDLLMIAGPLVDLVDARVEDPKGETERTVERDEEDDPHPICVVPDLVPERIVEDEAFALLPMVDVAVNRDANLVARLGDDEPQVVTHDAAVRAAVLTDVLARLENGKESRPESWNVFDELHRFRTLSAVSRTFSDEGVPLQFKYV